MTSAQVVETSVNVISNSPSQHHTHPDDRTLLNDDMTPGFKPFTKYKTFSNYHERLPFVNKNRKFWLEIKMVYLIPPESFRKRWKSSDVFIVSRSNPNNWKIRVPLVNSHSTRFTSAPFPAIRHCRCSRHCDLLLFSSNCERLEPGETPHPESPVPLRAFHATRIFRANGKRPIFPYQWCSARTPPLWNIRFI